MSTTRVLASALAALALGCAAETWPGGIQARLVWSPDQGVVVLDTLAHGSAARAGLEPGDQIVEVDGVDVAPLDAQQIHALLSGEVGTWAEITVRRDDALVPLRIERAPYGAH